MQGHPGRLRVAPTSRGGRSSFPGLLRGRSRLVRAADVLEQLVSAGSAGAVVLHRVAEELRDVVQPGVLCIPDVLTVVVPRLERVVLDGDEVVGDVLEAGLSGCHGLCLLLLRAGHRRYPLRGIETWPVRSGQKSAATPGSAALMPEGGTCQQPQRLIWPG